LAYKMQKLLFVKMVASGNDFIVIKDSWLKQKKRNLNLLAEKFCNRQYGIGADGLLLLNHSKRADIRMRIFNADGTEAQMCGNGARCAALFTRKRRLNIETKAGIIKAQVFCDNVKIQLTKPKDIKLELPIHIAGRWLKVNFINTGVPHTVIFVEGLDKIDVCFLGRIIRYHKKFLPQGTNVDFVEVLGKDKIKIRTYERGVEDETLACGTGAVAAALLTTVYLQVSASSLEVITKSGETLRVYFDKIGKQFENVWLEGKAKIICKGEFYV